MFAWRFSKRCYADPPTSAFDGEDSRRRGGRWSPPGLRVADLEDAPADLVSIRIEISEGIRCEHVGIASLPENWRNTPFPLELQDIGERWLMSSSSVCLYVPSAVIPRSSICLSTQSIRTSRRCVSQTLSNSGSMCECGRVGPQAKAFRYFSIRIA